MATTRRAPLSTPLIPSFHCSAWRMLKDSMSSPSISLTIRTPIWIPFVALRATRKDSSSERDDGDITPAASTTGEEKLKVPEGSSCDETDLTAAVLCSGCPVTSLTMKLGTPIMKNKRMRIPAKELFCLLDILFILQYHKAVVKLVFLCSVGRKIFLKKHGTFFHG